MHVHTHPSDVQFYSRMLKTQIFEREKKKNGTKKDWPFIQFKLHVG